jgi:hypothetical protein
MNTAIARRIASAITIAAAFGLGGSGSAAAAVTAEPDQVCQIGSRYFPGLVTRTPIARPSSGDVLYALNTGQWFRVVAYAGDYYYGHGDGRAHGYMDRDYIDQSTCHYT